MNIQARRISGSSFSAEDKLEVLFNSDNKDIAYLIHTIELVSGVGVTHGGNAHPDDYLHYKSNETDADSNGVIDYSRVVMDVVQQVQGVSVIKVVCSVITKEQADADKVAQDAYNQRVIDAGVDNDNPNGTDGTFTEEPPISNIAPEVFKTGEITLEWSEDVLV